MMKIDARIQQAGTVGAEKPKGGCFQQSVPKSFQLDGSVTSMVLPEDVHHLAEGIQPANHGVESLRTDGDAALT